MALVYYKHKSLDKNSASTPQTMILRCLIILLVPNLGRSASTSGSVGDRCTTPNDEAGECRGLKKCPVLLELLRENEPSSTSLLNESRCGFEGLESLVCCPDLSSRRPIWSDTVRNRTSSVSRPSSQSQTGGSSTARCGKNTIAAAVGDRIVGGQDAALGEWPWIAALGYTSSSRAGLQWLCGGALVTNRHVITAAHCVVIPQDKTLSVVRLGDLDLEEGVVDGASPVEVDVDRAIPHPNYRSSGKTDDIAVVRLKTQVQFNDFIQPICLPSTSYFRSTSLTGQKPYVAGWGALFFRGPSTKALQQVDVSITAENVCRNAYSSQRGAVIDNRVLCASNPGKDACQGDSGGPLMLGRDDTFYLIGVVSYGKNCADPQYPGVYTRVSSFINWINNNLN
ncbi:venom protease-like [Macrosteles quadrilineatus]|uniref:venom protease-like n=1 Tax=Macrosteles quadrilineatus TaxID=74068 RepID=UPI0023E2D900|nr:venom protease-like [Macrosteles quadrilineatus]